MTNTTMIEFTLATLCERFNLNPDEELASLKDQGLTDPGMTVFHLTNSVVILNFDDNTETITVWTRDPQTRCYVDIGTLINLD